jgi:hypothetical protein
VRKPIKWAGAGVALLLAGAIAAPFVAADQYGKRLQASLERALGRRVEIGAVHFKLLPLPALTVDSVTIHEDPAIGIEPVVYIQKDEGGMEVRPALWSLLGGRFVIASITLDGASVNLTKSGPAAEWGRWNFASLVNRSVMTTTPAIHVRDGRINLKFGDEKSVFYLNDTDLDISPPGSLGHGWRVYCSAQASRTDRPVIGLASFTLKGRWFVDPERVDMDLVLDRTGLGELTALVRGQPGAVYGTVYSRLHLGGPINNIGIAGRLTVEDLYRWDLLPPKGQGWPLDVRGRLDLVGQQLELESNSTGGAALPLSMHFHAGDYLSQPHWAVALNWNQFPVAPLVELARHMGAQFPPRLQLAGAIDGALGYSGRGSFQGELAFHNAAVTIPDSPPVRFEQAHVLFERGHIRLSPTVVQTADQDQARIEADYDMDQDSLHLVIGTDAMKVTSLRAQVALAAVPWLEQVQSGEWSGELRYHRDSSGSGWRGDLDLTDGRLSVPGLADPLLLASVHASIDGARIVLDDLDAQAGKIAFTGEYRYEPGARPHRLRLRAAQLDAADLENELLPTLRRNPGLIARALGRARLPAWLTSRDAEGSVQIDDLAIAGTHFDNVRAHLLWDAARVELDGIQAKLDRAAITGKLAVNLHGSRPAYKFTGKLKDMPWQSGKIDAEGTLESSGTGLQLLANLASGGTFAATALDFGAASMWRAFSGKFNLRWSASAPRLRLTALNLRTSDDTYTGSGSTLEDGRVMVVLTDGTREMRMTGSLAKLKVEEALKQ